MPRKVKCQNSVNRSERGKHWLHPMLNRHTAFHCAMPLHHIHNISYVPNSWPGHCYFHFGTERGQTNEKKNTYIPKLYSLLNYRKRFVYATQHVRCFSYKYSRLLESRRCNIKYIICTHSIANLSRPIHKKMLRSARCPMVAVAAVARAFFHNLNINILAGHSLQLAPNVLCSR